jgi:hypothetical protein
VRGPVPRCASGDASGKGTINGGLSPKLVDGDTGNAALGSTNSGRREDGNGHVPDELVVDVPKLPVRQPTCCDPKVV